MGIHTHDDAGLAVAGQTDIARRALERVLRLRGGQPRFVGKQQRGGARHHGARHGRTLQLAVLPGRAIAERRVDPVNIP